MSGEATYSLEAALVIAFGVPLGLIGMITLFWHSARQSERAPQRATRPVRTAPTDVPRLAAPTPAQRAARTETRRAA